MERTGEAKGDRPGERSVLDDGSKVGGGLLRSLATREEDDASEVLRHVGLQRVGGSLADFFRSRLMLVLLAGENHVAF